MGRDNAVNSRARGVLIVIFVIRAVAFFLTQEYMAYYKVE